MLVEPGLVAFSSACFEFADEIPKTAQHGSLAHLPKIFSSHLHGLSKVAVIKEMKKEKEKENNFEDSEPLVDEL